MSLRRAFRSIRLPPKNAFSSILSRFRSKVNTGPSLQPPASATEKPSSSASTVSQAKSTRTGPPYQMNHMKKPKRTPIALTLATADLPKLIEGLLPYQMEQKWHIFTIGPNPDPAGSGKQQIEVHMVRSWTGNEIFILHADVEEEAIVCREVVYESSKDVVAFTTVEDATGMVRDVLQWVMGIHAGRKVWGA